MLQEISNNCSPESRASWRNPGPLRYCIKNTIDSACIWYMNNCYYKWRNSICNRVFRNRAHAVSVVIALQMLLCVGSFFADSEQTKLQWENYVEGREKGELWDPLPTFHTHTLPGLTTSSFCVSQFPCRPISWDLGHWQRLRFTRVLAEMEERCAQTWHA